MRAFPLAFACILGAAGDTTAAPIHCVVAVEAIGLRPAQVAKLREHLRAEAGNNDTGVSFFGEAKKPARPCFDDARCVQNAVLGLDVGVVLHLQLVRVGGTVQLVVRSHRASTGEELHTATLEVAAQGFPQSVPVDEILTAALHDLRAPTPSPDPPETVAAEPVLLPPVEAAPPAAVQPGLAATPPPARRASLTSVLLTAAGGALVVAGIVMAASQEATLNNERTAGDAKETAHTVGRIGWGAMGVGAVMTTTGLVMLGLELFGN